MDCNASGSGRKSLERSCGEPRGDWLSTAGPLGGVELLRAWFAGEAYADHRHDTYAIGLTDSGVQVFDYRGSRRVSLPGQVAALYPDELHNGRAGTAEGFGYRIVYVEPAQLAEALRALCGRPYPMPFIGEGVTANPWLARAIGRAFQAPLESLAVDSLVLELAEGLLATEQGAARPMATPLVDSIAVERARQFLDAERTRVVLSSELAAIAGLTRYELARQFKRQLGTSPHRYLLMRRLGLARQLIDGELPLAAVATEVGFADQAHLTRMFKAAFGLTPARYRALRLRQRA
jgi:AraC-like DNA-binding protein